MGEADESTSGSGAQKPAFFPSTCTPGASPESCNEPTGSDQIGGAEEEAKHAHRRSAATPTMPCRKVPKRLIETALARAETHARRTKGLQKKASELATLCAVPVALVCSAGKGAPPLVWESEEGVLERYRRAVPAEPRARPPPRSTPPPAPTAGNTPATLRQHPFLIQGKPTQCA